MLLSAPRACLPAIPPDLPDESPHYIRAVTELGDSTGVIASEDIYASNGMKLLAKGARIDQRAFARLTQHRLAVPIDHSLLADQPVDTAVLAMEAGKIMEQHPVYRRMATRCRDPLALKHALAELPLPSPVVMRLTVMKERRRPIYDHSLRTAIIAGLLAEQLRRPAPELPAALLAALCHDVGELHTDPAVLAIGHAIAPEERRFVHVHPITGYVLLRELPGFPPAAAVAVLQHHERLDGSGYPHDLPGDKIGPLARLVAVADVAEAVIKRYHLPRLDMLFRLNASRFDPSMVAALRDLAHVTAQDVVPDEAGNAAAAQLSHLAELLKAWFTLRAMLEAQFAPEPAERSPLAFLFERMNTIRQLVLQAGFDPDNMSSMLAIAREDPGILAELRGMLDEMDWLLVDLANEIDRRSPELIGMSSGALKGLLGHLRPPAGLSG